MLEVRSPKICSVGLDGPSLVQSFSYGVYVGLTVSLRCVYTK